MTKYEWERQLKKGISGLPKAEQQRVLDYYNELFADKIDAGLREQYIISEFGNPYDVANKILVDYYNGDKENPEVDAYIYADSDDIDDAFDEAPTATTEVPKRKTWAEHREERREEHEARRVEHVDGNDIPDDDTTQKTRKGARSASGLIALVCVLVYCVLGACFNLWHPGWLIFLAIPCVITLIEAITKRNWRIFSYPVFVTLMFLLAGFNSNKWHPAWILFLTIPLYYVLGNFITKNADGTKRDVKSKKPDRKENKSDNDGQKAYEEPAKAEKKTAKSNSNTSVVALIAKILMSICLVGVAIVVCWWVIGLFIGGVGMIIGGIGTLVYAFVGGTVVNWLIAGAGIAVLGLGLVCTFGMAALFKPCINMCKSFVRTIKKSFDSKEAVR